MRSLVVILLAVALCEARPSQNIGPFASMGPDSYILGGVEASPGEFPWQLSQTRNGGHSCGASLLSANYALSAAHCLENAAVGILGIWAGLHDRSQTGDGVQSAVASYRLHESYNSGEGTFPNDIAIITLATQIAANGGNIQYATLPANNDDHFVGQIWTLSGWGRTSASNTLPNTLQKVDIPSISKDECNTRMAPVSGALVTDRMVCFYDTSNSRGSCSGDSGGPANINVNGVWTVGGVTSWGISSLIQCLPSYPSVYTRTSAYLGWITDNTP